MSSFENVLYYEGFPLYPDDGWWLVYRSNLYWSDKPWVLPEPEALEQDSDFACEEAIGLAGGSAYSAFAEKLVTLPEGFAVLFDPQVFTGKQWYLFDPSKNIVAMKEVER